MVDSVMAMDDVFYEGSVARRAEVDARRREERRYLAERLDERCLAIIGRRFGVHQACFQGVRGQFDPLDAMRRDAYREVYMWLRKELRLYRKEIK